MSFFNYLFETSSYPVIKHIDFFTFIYYYSDDYLQAP